VIDPVEHLRGLLNGRELPSLRSSTDIDEALRAIKARASSIGQREVSVDAQMEAVRQFYETNRLSSSRQGRLVSFGLCVRPMPDKAPIIEDRARLTAVLEQVDQWVEVPRQYRRCYQGLLSSYFDYDSQAAAAPTVGRENWVALRQYLSDRLPAISTNGTEPDWVSCALANRGVLQETPCAAYAVEVLSGDDARVKEVRSALRIGDASWFSRELVLAQVLAATGQSDRGFVAVLPRVLPLVDANSVLRDVGLRLVLDRYATMAAPAVHNGLRDCAIRWWGNPWLPSNRVVWTSVSDAARRMVADWLKLEFIESFFTLLAEEGTADPRRLEFWKRYFKTIDTVQFALGSEARFSRTRDFVELRAKMKGATVELLDPVGSNNAFIMTIGDLVVVEFSGRANALYGYSRKAGLPFTLDRSVVTTKDGENSLKSSRHVLRLRHADHVHGWDTWEDLFEGTFRRQFGVEPDAKPSSRPTRLTTRTQPADRPAVQGWPARFDADALNRLVRQHGLSVQDNSTRGGNLWVLARSFDATVDRTLKAWGFTFRPGKGWWR
jgi:hypothetical protein